MWSLLICIWTFVHTFINSLRVVCAVPSLALEVCRDWIHLCSLNTSALTPPSVLYRVGRWSCNENFCNNDEYCWLTALMFLYKACLLILMSIRLLLIPVRIRPRRAPAHTEAFWRCFAPSGAASCRPFLTVYTPMYSMSIQVLSSLRST